MSSPIDKSDDEDGDVICDNDVKTFKAHEDLKYLNADEDVKAVTDLKVHEIVKTGKTRTIMGITVSLPVTPYVSQMAIMNNVITALIKKENCLVNSPTGTGKTLALLGATLAWQKKEKEARRNDQDNSSIYTQPKQGNGSTEVIASPVKKNTEQPDVFFSKPSYGKKSIYDAPIQHQAPTCSKYAYEETNKRPFNNSQEGKPEAGLVNIHKKRKTEIVDLREPSNSLGSPVKELAKGLDDILNSQQGTSTQLNSEIPVIYYSSRTHKQIEQVVKEFKRTVYGKDATMSILSSREYSCIREFDKTLWKSKNEMCKACTKTSGTSKDNNCKYYNNRKALTYETISEAFDLNKLIDTAERLSACPYYAAKEMATSANIVFCPYNYLINSGIRKNMNINLKDNIVIIDEGHNIENICRDTGSYILKKEEFDQAIKELTDAKNYANTYKMAPIEHILSVLNELDKLWFVDQKKKFDVKEKTLRWEIEDFVTTLNVINVGCNLFKDYVLELNRCLRDDPKSLIGVTEITGNLLESLENIYDFLFREGGKYKMDFKPVLIRNLQTNRRNDEYTEKELEEAPLLLHLICLNPAVVFESLLEASTVILASGTLDPVESLESELGVKFLYKAQPTPKFFKENVWVGKRADNNLDFTHGSRSQHTVQDALGDAVLRVCEHTPHGVLAFLPSYEFLDTLVDRWKNQGIWEKLQKLKNVFTEKKDLDEHEKIMQEYCSHAKNEGALLLAVYRGKVSEGMDFPDQQARAVIAVGIPYPSKYDIAVKAKMAYNDYNKLKKGLLSGWDWYTAQAYRALNQALGRCVRHKDDWGAVLLLDKRHKHIDFKNLPKWIKDKLNAQNPEQSKDLSGLKKFMDNKKKE